MIDKRDHSCERKKMKSFCRSFADKKIKLNGIIYYHDVNNLKCSKVIYLNILSMYSAIGFRAKKCVENCFIISNKEKELVAKEHLFLYTH